MMLLRIEFRDVGTPEEIFRRRKVDGGIWLNAGPAQQITVADSCQACLDRLTAAELSSLSRYAGFRLAKVGLNFLDGEDIVQDALLAVLRGLEFSTAGRHPRPCDLETQTAFMVYLRGVIGSLVEAKRRGRKPHYVSEALDESLSPTGTDPFPSACDPRADFEFSDFKEQFFRRLCEQAPRRLQALVSAWQQQWGDCEAIPLLGCHRRRRSELRKLATKVLRRLSVSNCRINLEGN